MMKTAALAAVFLILASQFREAGAERLVPLADGFRWPHVSSLISYDGRLWFANSRKYVNHNSADIWSYDVRTGDARYERHLFSQDAGDPAVHGGLLYWPFEDSRFSPGRGEFMVTDGRAWRWIMLPEGRAFHLHAMASGRDVLYAAPSAWTAKLQSSDDGGAHWRMLYEHPTPDGRVSRITALAAFDGAVYGGLVTWYRSPGGKLLRWDGARFAQVPGWPEGNAVPRMVAWRGWLYGQNIGGEGSSLWRTDGRRVEKVEAMSGRPIRGLAAGAGALWAAAGSGKDGELWRSADGMRWELQQRFPGVELHGVAVHEGRIYAGGGAADGSGVLLGPAPGPAVAGAAPLAPARPDTGALPEVVRLTAADAAPHLRRLKAALAVPASYDRGLRAYFRPLARPGDAETGRALSALLDGPFPDAEATMFGGRQFAAADMARWYLLWTVAHNGHGRVPPALIGMPWRSEANRAEKYFEAAPAAAWAAARLGQDDGDTLAALIVRLDRPGDPTWLAGDIVGALTELTGQRFAYDIAAWKRWWADRSR